MPTIFRVGPGAGYGTTYRLDVGHDIWIPGVRCSVCGQTWSITGVAYPLAALSRLPPAVRKPLGGPPVDEVTLAGIVKGVRQIVPEPSFLGTGTALGPSSGKARGTIPMIPHMTPWTFFVRQDAIQALEDLGVRGLRAAPLSLTGKHKTPSPIMEVAVDARARLAAEWFGGAPPTACAGCGRQALVLDHPLVLDRASIPEELDVFRGVDATTAVFVTESFRAAAESLNIDSVVFEPIRVA